MKILNLQACTLALILLQAALSIAAFGLLVAWILGMRDTIILINSTLYLCLTVAAAWIFVVFLIGMSLWRLGLHSEMGKEQIQRTKDDAPTR